MPRNSPIIFQNWRFTSTVLLSLLKNTTTGGDLILLRNSSQNKTARSLWIMLVSIVSKVQDSTILSILRMEVGGYCPGWNNSPNNWTSTRSSRILRIRNWLRSDCQVYQSLLSYSIRTLIHSSKTLLAIWESRSAEQGWPWKITRPENVLCGCLYLISVSESKAKTTNAFLAKSQLDVLLLWSQVWNKDQSWIFVRQALPCSKYGDLT